MIPSRPTCVSIPYKSGQHFKIGEEWNFTLPNDAAVSIPYKSGQHFKSLLTIAAKKSKRERFNPLQIGSTLQNELNDDPMGLRSGRRFNPLQIGSTLQKRNQ